MKQTKMAILDAVSDALDGPIRTIFRYDVLSPTYDLFLTSMWPVDEFDEAVGAAVDIAIDEVDLSWRT